jgi:NAD(P)-dependent dehydrogenase (short-subunit alcohol dehydrogenase family)
MRFTDKRLIITGAGGGIGGACARLAVAEGARVALAGRKLEDLQRTANALPAASVLTVACDVSREEDTRRLFARVITAWGGVDGLVNCAAVFRRADFANLSLTAWEEVLAVNLTGTFLCCRESFRVMQPGGAIVNVASLSGVPGVEKFPGFAAYNVSKYGVVGLTEMLGLEGNGLGLRVNCVSPAAVETPMLRQAAPQLPPAMQPEDAARVILWLLSDESRAVTSTNLPLFGPVPTPALGQRSAVG